jgi:hypothetical protein
VNTLARKKCSKCRCEKNADEFFKNRSRSDNLSAWCKACRKLFDRTQSSRDKQNSHCKEYRRRKRAVKLLGALRVRAKKKGLKYDLDAHGAEIQRRIDKGVCEMTGIALDLDAMLAFNSPSIDRIDNNQGYVIENVRIVCLAMNFAMNTWGEETLAFVMSAWFEKRKQNQVDAIAKNCDPK